MNIKNASERPHNYEKVQAIASIADTLPGIVIILNMQTLGVDYMSNNGLEILGTSLDEIRSLGAEYHERYFNAKESEEHIKIVRQLLETNNPEQVLSLFQQVRPTPNHDWEWYQSSLRIFSQDNDDKPLQIIAFVVAVEPDYHLTNRLDELLNEKIFFKENLEAFSSLTNRERQVLQHLAQGKTNKQIAEDLFISTPTMETHKRNIKQKLNIQTPSQLLQFASAFSFA